MHSPPGVNSTTKMHTPPGVNITASAIHSIRVDLAWTEAYVSIAFVLLMIVFVIGIVRRRHRYGQLQFLAWLPYSLLFFMIPYILGLILNNLFFGGKVLSFFWAVLLLFIYGSVDNFNAVDLDDRRRGKVFFFKDLYQALIFLLGFFTFHGHLKFVVVLPLVMVLVFSQLKIVERTIGLMYSTCNIPPLVSCPLLKKTYNDDDEDDMAYHGDPVQGCRYLIEASATHDNEIVGITVSKIWRCEDGILLSSNRHRGNHLKDCCLSFSLFWMLLRRYVGFPSHESSHQKEAWNLVRKGLLAQQGEHERPFRVVEAELSFLYDFFYSKYFCFYQIGLWWQLKHFLFLGVIAWIVTLYFTAYHGSDDPFRIEFEEYNVDTLVTKVVITIIMLVEVIQFIIFITSRWAKVMILCLYVTRESWKKKSIIDCFVTQVARIICCIPLHESFNTWRNELSQYSLLESYSHLQCFPGKLLNIVSLITGLFVPRAGRKESKSIKVSDEVKRAVILSLQKHGPHLTNGMNALKASELSEDVVEKLSWVNIQPKTDIHVILVWHIATTLCEVDIDELHSFDETDHHFEVASSLSKYCAYLVAFVPELLPGYTATTDNTCSQAIEDARTLLNSYKRSASTRHGKLKQIADHVSDIEVGQANGTIIEQGIKLRKDLVTQIGDPKKRWEVLAALWAEMILFLAPNPSNEMAHAEKLADGGEFITHLWVLLFHAGIVDKNCFTNMNFQSSSVHSNNSPSSC